MRVVRGERDALPGHFGLRNIRGPDQRLWRHADQGHELGRGTDGASDQGHHAGVSTAIDKDCTGRATRAEQASADQLGQLWRDRLVECVCAAADQNNRGWRYDAECVAQRGNVLVSLPDDLRQAFQARCAIHPWPLRSTTVSILRPGSTLDAKSAGILLNL